jgi:hypothetical protein
MTHQVKLPPLARVEELRFHPVHLGWTEVEPLTPPEEVRVVGNGVGLGGRAAGVSNGAYVAYAASKLESGGHTSPSLQWVEGREGFGHVLDHRIHLGRMSLEQGVEKSPVLS